MIVRVDALVVDWKGRERNDNSFITMNRKGFTLIELLIVIAIIGILASVILVGIGGSRGSARDTRRIADLKQVQTALELYYTKCGIYPGGTDCKPAVMLDWIDLQTTLTNVATGIGVKTVPDDPLGGSKHYFYATGPGQGGNPNTGYITGAVLEVSNAGAMSGSYKGGAASSSGLVFPGNCGTGLLYCLALGF